VEKCVGGYLVQCLMVSTVVIDVIGGNMLRGVRVLVLLSMGVPSCCCDIADR